MADNGASDRVRQRRRVRFPCIVCDRSCGVDTIECSGCSSWVHRHCMPMTADKYIRCVPNLDRLWKLEFFATQCIYRPTKFYSLRRELCIYSTYVFFETQCVYVCMYVCMYLCMYVSFGQGFSLLWTQTLRPFYSRPIALNMRLIDSHPSFRCALKTHLLNIALI